MTPTLNIIRNVIVHTGPLRYILGGQSLKIKNCPHGGGAKWQKSVCILQYIYIIKCIPGPFHLKSTPTHPTYG